MLAIIILLLVSFYNYVVKCSSAGIVLPRRITEDNLLIIDACWASESSVLADIEHPILVLCEDNRIFVCKASKASASSSVTADLKVFGAVKLEQRLLQTEYTQMRIIDDKHVVLIHGNTVAIYAMFKLKNSIDLFLQKTVHGETDQRSGDIEGFELIESETAIRWTLRMNTLFHFKNFSDVHLVGTVPCSIRSRSSKRQQIAVVDDGKQVIETVKGPGHLKYSRSLILNCYRRSDFIFLEDMLSGIVIGNTDEYKTPSSSPEELRSLYFNSYHLLDLNLMKLKMCSRPSQEAFGYIAFAKTIPYPAEHALSLQSPELVEPISSLSLLPANDSGESRSITLRDFDIRFARALAIGPHGIVALVMENGLYLMSSKPLESAITTIKLPNEISSKVTMWFEMAEPKKIQLKPTGEEEGLTTVNLLEIILIIHFHPISDNHIQSSEDEKYGRGQLYNLIFNFDQTEGTFQVSKDGFTLLRQCKGKRLADYKPGIADSTLWLMPSVQSWAVLSVPSIHPHSVPLTRIQDNFTRLGVEMAIIGINYLLKGSGTFIGLMDKRKVLMEKEAIVDKLNDENNKKDSNPDSHLL